MHIKMWIISETLASLILKTDNEEADGMRTNEVASCCDHYRHLCTGHKGAGMSEVVPRLSGTAAAVELDG